jgi:vacuolar-type H+-ATPase subunit D/Vma8
MAKLTKTDEFLERLGIEMDHVKAGLMELKAKGRTLKLEARLEYDRGLKSLEKKEQELKVRMGEWSKAGQKAGEDMKQALERAAKDLKKAVDNAYARLK